MLTIRQLTATNGHETRDLLVFARDGRLYLWDCTADPHCNSAVEVPDQSDTSIMDAIRDSGFEIVESRACDPT